MIFPVPPSSARWRCICCDRVGREETGPKACFFESPLFHLRIPAKVNGDSGIVNTDSGAVNGNSGQGERGGTGGSMLRAVILGRGGFSADWLLFRGEIAVFFRGQSAAGSGESPVLALPAAGFLRKDSPVIVRRWWFCINRSSMASAIVGSPIHSCQCSMGS